MSAQNCGCDPEASHVCEWHRLPKSEVVVGSQYTPTVPISVTSGGGIGATVRIPYTHETYRVKAQLQTFETGATRNDNSEKFDYEAFLNPDVLHEFGKFMHHHRRQKDGSVRDGDNWQKGIPFKAYIKSLVRHSIDLWRMHRGYTVINPDTGEPHTREELCCAVMFNAMGYLKELLHPSVVNLEGP